MGRAPSWRELPHFEFQAIASLNFTLPRGTRAHTSCTMNVCFSTLRISIRTNAILTLTSYQMSFKSCVSDGLGEIYTVRLRQPTRAYRLSSCVVSDKMNILHNPGAEETSMTTAITP